MNKLLMLIMSTFGSVCLSWAAASEPAKPNVLIFVADDLGYRDVGFQGCQDIATPNLDALAAKSVRCTNGYVSHCFCSPTRAGLLTGRYQHRFGHETNPAWLPQSTTSGLPLSEITLPQSLKPHGYSTGLVGKWHLGAHPQFHPMKRGFDECFSALGGGHEYFPKPSNKSEYQLALDRNGVQEEQKSYLTDQFGDEATAFVNRHSGKPWFLYLAFNAPHTPLQAPPEAVAKLDKITDPRRRNYAAMIQILDANIGKVLARLDETKQRENTLIFFISDNGGPHIADKDKNPKFTDNTPLRGAKGSMLEGGIRIPFLVSWPAKLKPGVYDKPLIALDIFATALAQAGGTLPSDRKMDSVNLIPHLSGGAKIAPHDMLFWRNFGPGGEYAVRHGNWKLIRVKAQAAQLYDLASDIGEKKDLADEKPEIVAKLVSAITEWEKGTIPPAFLPPKPQPKK
ncbi:MAG: sulfatase-like hydrolase/transferase [Fimbriiglobus sp.]